MFYLSVKIRLFILLSVLMALILAVQFYFSDKAQQELLSEIQRFSTSINIATDNYYWNVLRQFETTADSIPDSSDNSLFIRGKFTGPGSLRTEIHFPVKAFSRGTTHGSDEMSIRIEKDLKSILDKTVGDTGFVHRIRDVVQERTNTEREIEALILPGKKALVRDSLLAEGLKVLPRLPGDSLRRTIETININLNSVLKRTGDSLGWVRGFREFVPPPKNSRSISFQMPDFSVPAEPRILQYHYNTASLEAALVAARNRNIIITLLIFFLSMLIILYISNRFLKPVGDLKTAFDRVVDGDLNVAVSGDRRDEIGDLAVSFNRMVEELRKNREKEEMLQRKERLASLGQLAAGVAHEVKNPLNAIHLTIQHLRDRYTAEDLQARKYTDSVQQEIRRLDKIVNNFLNFLRSEDLQKTETDLAGLVKEVLHLYQREFASRKIEVDSDGVEPFIRPVDAARMKTVVVNLVLNAIQAMPGGGRLTVETAVSRGIIRIADNGAGIPAKNLDHIFDLFYTTKSGGSGLGLPTAYKIVKAHGGDIRIRSVVNEGTTVEIVL